MYKGPCEEIKELDDEYLYTSGMQSSENTERIVAAAPNAPGTYAGEAADTKLKNSAEFSAGELLNLSKDKFQPPSAFERQSKEAVHESDTDSPFKRQESGKLCRLSGVEELEYPVRAIHSENKNVNHMSSFDSVSPIVKTGSVGPRLLLAKLTSDCKRGVRSPPLKEFRDGKSDDRLSRTRNFRSNDRFDVSGQKKHASTEDFELVGKLSVASKGKPNFGRTAAKQPQKALRANINSFTYLNDSNKSVGTSGSNLSVHYHTHASNRAGNTRNTRETLFHDIIKRTSQMFVSPFLKNRKTGEINLNLNLSDEKLRREEALVGKREAEGMSRFDVRKFQSDPSGFA